MNLQFLSSVSIPFCRCQLLTNSHRWSWEGHAPSKLYSWINLSVQGSVTGLLVGDFHTSASSLLVYQTLQMKYYIMPEYILSSVAIRYQASSLLHFIIKQGVYASLLLLSTQTTVDFLSIGYLNIVGYVVISCFRRDVDRNGRERERRKSIHWNWWDCLKCSFATFSYMYTCCQPSGEPATIKWLTVGGRTSAYVSELQQLPASNANNRTQRPQRKPQPTEVCELLYRCYIYDNLCSRTAVRAPWQIWQNLIQKPLLNARGRSDHGL